MNFPPTPFAQCEEEGQRGREAQIKQSARGPVQSFELCPPTPHPQASVAPPPQGSKGGDTLACGGAHEGDIEQNNTLSCFTIYINLVFNDINMANVY